MKPLIVHISHKPYVASMYSSGLTGGPDVVFGSPCFGRAVVVVVAVTTTPPPLVFRFVLLLNMGVLRIVLVAADVVVVLIVAFMSI